jgi:hypothetical protein
MTNFNLYITQTVHVAEQQWFAAGYAPTGHDPANPLIRSQKTYSIHSCLFAAADAEAAYRRVAEELESDADRNFDGEGHLTLFYGLGVHEIEQLVCPLSELLKVVQGLYGLDVGVFVPTDVDSQGIPLVRAKADLEVFRNSAS